MAHWRHSMAAAISIASGLISLCMFQGYMDDVEKVYVNAFSKMKMYGHLIIENRKWNTVEGKSNPLKYSITPESQALIENFFNEHKELVKVWVRFLNVSGMISNGRESTIFDGRGYDLESGMLIRQEAYKWDALYGLPLDQNINKDSISLGHNLAKLLGCTEERQINFYTSEGGYLAGNRPFICKHPIVQITSTTENEQVNALDLEVSGFINGIYKEIDNKLIHLSLENAQMLLDTKKISYYTVLIQKDSYLYEFMEKIKKFSTENNLDLEVRDWPSHPVGEMYSRTMELLTIFRNFIVTVILFIAGLSIFNTMVKIVKERTKEIGTLRSLGFSSHQVIKIFMNEAFLLGGAGVVFGSIFSILMTHFVNWRKFSYKAGVLTKPVLFRIEISVKLYVTSALILLTLTLLTSFLATRRTTKKKIIECMTDA